MNLTEYFLDKPRGAKVQLALQLGISKTWLSLVISGRKLPSPELARDIEALTGRRVKRADLRPDIFGKTAK
jgi:DNA-binding transcriptional regulator YdaS (Cro superfamily)